MKNFLLLTSLILSMAIVTNANANWFENMSPTQKVLLHMELKKKLTGKSKRSKKEPLNCAKEFQKQKSKYQEEICHGGSRFQEVGFMSEKFNREEIQTMKKGHPHLRPNVRGQPGLVDRSVYSGRPDFPHAKNGCERYFNEEVEIVEIDGKFCRQIIFSAPEVEGSYIQQYCEDDNSLFIYFE